MKLKIGDITLNFKYHFHEYFQDHIQAYQINGKTKTDYKMSVILSSEIPTMNHLDFEIIKNRSYYVSNQLHVATIYKDIDPSIITQQIIFDKVKKDVKIYLNPNEVKDLKMQEYVLSGIMFLEIALMEGYLPLHASAIAFDDDAILFSAPSQTGKSTHTKYWKSYFKERVEFINDDKPLLFYRDNICYVTGTPFSGKSTLNKNIVKPVKSIIFLSQGKSNKIESFSSTESLKYFLQNTWRPKEESLWDKTFQTIDQIMSDLPIYHFQATHDISSVLAIYQTLYKEQKDEN